MTKRIRKGDIVSFVGKDTRWIIHSVYYGGTMCHMTLESQPMGEGAALSIPTKSIEKVQDRTPESLAFVDVPVSRLT